MMQRNETTVERNKTPTPGAPRQLWLRRADQAAVGGLVLAALLALAGYWFAQGGIQGRLVEIDRAPALEARFAVDINQADWAELSQIPGIGETLARRIVSLRGQRGPFAEHDDLLRVKGIGRKTLDRMRPYLLPLPEGGAVANR